MSTEELVGAYIALGITFGFIAYTVLTATLFFKLFKGSTKGLTLWTAFIALHLLFVPLVVYVLS
jgi:hypothetical protein